MQVTTDVINNNNERKQMYRLVDPNKDRQFEFQNKDPESKQYLVCFHFNSNDSKEWNICNGRTEAREYIIDSLSTYDDIDFSVSFILVESCRLIERQSIPAFM